MPSIYNDKQPTVAVVNHELKRLGHSERLRRGRGYYYFDGDAISWYSSSVCVNDMEGTTLQFWIDAFNELRRDPRNAGCDTTATRTRDAEIVADALASLRRARDLLACVGAGTRATHAETLDSVTHSTQFAITDLERLG